MTGEDISNGCKVIIDEPQARTGVPASFALDVVFLVVAEPTAEEYNAFFDAIMAMP